MLHPGLQQRLATSSVKGQVVNTLGFAGRVARTTDFCPCILEVAIGNM